MLKPGSFACLSALALAAGLATAGAARAEGQYTVVKSVALGAPDRWDYVVFDPESHRVFVAHGDEVSVVDGRSGAIVGTITGVPGGTHGTAISAASGRGYTDDGQAGQAVAFDLKTLKVTGRLKANDDADAIALDPKTGHVFVIEGDPAAITVIDPKTDKVVADIAVGEKLEYAVAGDGGQLYVNGEAKGDIVRIDTATNRVTAHWPMPGCASPHGLAMDRAAMRLFSTCANGLLEVVDARDGKVVATLPIGKGSDAAAFDPKRKRVFSPNGVDGDLTVIQEKADGSYAELATVKTAATGKTMSIDPDSGRLYIAAASVDPTGPTTGRPKILPGSLRLLFLDPAP